MKKRFEGKLETFADSVESLINVETQNTNNALVIAINSEWGLGKTTFIDRLGIKLQNQGKIALKFDAWKFDHTDEPGLSFIAKMEFDNLVFMITKALTNSL